MTTNPTTPATLDFARIRQECPKAFGKLQVWLIENYQREIKQRYTEGEPLEWDYWREPTHHRDLYDFFDAQGVYVSVMFNNGKKVANWYRVFVQTKGLYCHDVFTESHPTRAEAETAGFERAFEILEERLTE